MEKLEVHEHSAHAGIGGLPFSWESKLKIVHHGDGIVVIDKPSGLPVHRSDVIREKFTCMNLLRNQIGCWVYPAHRLDRATSGLLLFALNETMASALGRLFREQKVLKKYWAIVRGFSPQEGVVERALREEKHLPYQEAKTAFKKLAQIEFPKAVGKYETARYTLLEVEIFTGRRHQIRKHLSHIAHPVIGDTTYGDLRHNHFFRDSLGVNRLMLHSKYIQFENPISKRMVSLTSETPEEFGGIIPY